MDVSGQFEGKIAIVTGSTQGLGEATARLFAERGAAGIVITGRDRARGEAVAASLDTDACRAILTSAVTAAAASRSAARSSSVYIRPTMRFPSGSGAAA